MYLEIFLGMKRWFLSLNFLVKNKNLKHKFEILLGIFFLR
jgi:hypothetical protein